MNMHTERQEVMLMTQEMAMFLLDLELKYFPVRILTQQHTSQPLLDEMLSESLNSSYLLKMVFHMNSTYILVRRWCSSFLCKALNVVLP